MRIASLFVPLLFAVPALAQSEGTPAPVTETAPAQQPPSAETPPSASSEGAPSTPTEKSEKSGGCDCGDGHRKAHAGAGKHHGDGCGHRKAEGHAEADDDGHGYASHGGHHGMRGHWARANNPWRYSLELGPSFRDGASATLSFRPNPRWAFGIGATAGRGLRGGGDFGPGDGGPDRGPFGDDDGLSRSTRHGYYLSATRYFGGRRGGFFLGAQAGASELLLRDITADVESRYWAAVVSPVAGYQWFPFQRSFFIKPYVGASASYAFRGPVRVGEQTEGPFQISPRMGVNLGFAL